MLCVYMSMCHCHFCVSSEEFAFVTGCWLFHPSWHMCIYKRMFESENKTLTKEGILHFLELYETKHLPHSLGFSEVRVSTCQNERVFQFVMCLNANCLSSVGIRYIL